MFPFSARSYSQVIWKFCDRSCQPSDVPANPTERFGSGAEQARASAQESRWAKSIGVPL